MRKAVTLFLLAAIYALPVMGESRLIPPMGLSETTADGLYVKQDGSLTPDMTGNLGVTVAGNPATFTNTTDTVNNVLGEFYSNRGTGASADEIQLDFYFDDDASTKVKAGSWVIKGDDLGAKGGAFATAIWRSGSAAPADIFKADGEKNTIFGNFFSIDLGGETLTGITGTATQIDTKVNNITAWSITPTQFQFLTGREGRFDDTLTTGGEFCVGCATSGEIPTSSTTYVKSTTEGAMPVPVMTTAQRTAIGSPATGLQVDDSDLNALTRYNGSGYDVFSVNVPTIKSGTVAGASFAGNPKIYTVTFNTAFPDTNYSVAVISEESRSWTFQSKLAGSFVMNSNANLALTLNVDWIATAHNDP